MENQKEFTSMNEDASGVNSWTDEEILNDMIKKASLGGESSEEEYISADDKDDEVENSEVIKSVYKNTEETEKPEEKNGCSGTDEVEGDEEQKDKEEDIVDENEERKKQELLLTEEERQDRQNQGQKHKDSGNIFYRNGDTDEAIAEYTKALELCPMVYHKERAVMFANRAACKKKKEQLEEAIVDSNLAIEMHPQYVKAILRRAELYEKTDKFDESLKDYETVLQLDPGNSMSRVACVRLQEKIKDRNEKLKTEMMGKLKDLGNMVLRPFGLSTNNFKLQQDPNSGGYSVQFEQNPSGNGS